jgi:hypothetical protein
MVSPCHHQLSQWGASPAHSAKAHARTSKHEERQGAGDGRARGCAWAGSACSWSWIAELAGGTAGRWQRGQVVATRQRTRQGSTWVSSVPVMVPPPSSGGKCRRSAMRSRFTHVMQCTGTGSAVTHMRLMARPSALPANMEIGEGSPTGA